MLKQIIARVFGRDSKDNRQEEKNVTNSADTSCQAPEKKPVYLTSEQVAENNILECVSIERLITKVKWEDIIKSNPNLFSKKEAFSLTSHMEYANQFYLLDGKYLLFHPANDGMPTCPFEWYWVFGDGRPKEVMNNQTAFNTIINLEEVLYKMISLFERCIDEDIVLDPMAFALKLEDDVCPNYKGRAKLVLTNEAVCTNSVHQGKLQEAKMHYINIFLDHFLGWNFGKVIMDNPRLEGKVKEFNNLVIKKGMRKDAGPGFRVWCSEEVVHYDLNKT